MVLPVNPGYGLTAYAAAPMLTGITDTTAVKAFLVDVVRFKMTGLPR
jgi:hypothetical protein